MKRIIAAVSLVAVAAPAFAAGLPYEETQFDRGITTQEQGATGGSTLANNVWAQDFNFIAPAQ